MNRVFLLVLGGLLIGAAPADWTRTVNRTADGAYVVGNPQAKVKLIEYLSYTCPHCAEYSVESTPVLKGKYVRSGSTRVEFRHATRDELDLAAAIAARCTGAAGFAGATETLFAKQGEWFPRGYRYQQINAERMSIYSQNARLKVLADVSGIAAIVKGLGASDAALAACYDDYAALLQLAVMSDGAWKAINQAAAPRPGGTPTFVINGKPYSNVGWAGLDKALQAAGAR